MTFKKNLRNIKYLVGNADIVANTSLPYDENICNFLGDLSVELNKDKLIKKYPDVKTFAFWCRKKNIYNLKKQFLSKETRLGLGLIFHITPSIIPTNFAYSLIFGLITGNSNIVKVPSNDFKQIDIICSSINKILSYTNCSYNIFSRILVYGLDHPLAFLGFCSWGGAIPLAFFDGFSCKIGIFVSRTGRNFIRHLDSI